MASANERVKRYQQRLIDEGKCIMCRGPVEEEGVRRCKSCKEKRRQDRKERRRERKELGLCTRCGENSSMDGYERCEQCSLKRRSSKLWGTVDRYKDLQQLLKDQNKTCPYTGRTLSPANGEIDHITPEAEGGKNNVQNLEWVHEKVNRMKGALEKEEFLSLVKEVANYRTQ